MSLDYVLVRQNEWEMENGIVWHVLITLCFGANRKGFSLHVYVSMQRFMAIAFSRETLSLIESLQINTPLIRSDFSYFTWISLTTL